ncbi:MAG: response regulator [Desulfococcaceae bacterium]
MEGCLNALKKILIVDDSPVARMMLKSCLPKAKEFSLAEAGNGREAIEKYFDFGPELTFMDLTMPEMDGYAAIERIRERDPEARIVVMTADVQKRAVERVQNLGALDILKKPPRAEVVFQTLSRIEAEMTQTPVRTVFSEREKDILQEIMNIAFGNAAADLSEIIDIYVELTAPKVRLIGAAEIPGHISERMRLGDDGTSLVVQNFWGNFNGMGLLVLPENAGMGLIRVMQDLDGDEDRPLAHQEREILMEVGNILIGACVGKICELLDTFVTYTPPRIVSEAGRDGPSFLDSLEEDRFAILLETVFRFESVDINGQLLLITSQNAIEWLRKALNAFMEQWA